MKVAYRSDIDGLRAIAVLLVVAFHAFPYQFPGGFIGVDVFFVISGFLITSLIYKGLDDGSFRFSEFYARRIKRIFPALVVVLIACLLAGWLLLFPEEYNSLGKHVAAGAAFIVNFSLLQEADYFDAAAKVKPLLHLWSLGIEEQFYIAWPVLMLLLWRWKNGPLFVSGIIFIGSFTWNVALVSTKPAAAFYLPFTRFWELMLGCILAFMSMSDREISAKLPELLGRSHATKRKTITELAAWGGIILLALAVVMINGQRSFPGFWALLPTIGAGLLIWAGPEASINRLLLSHRAMVYVGLVSYPLYLWHWPILTFTRIVRINEPTDLIKIAAVAAAFLLAHYTYRFVEKPIRFGAAMQFKSIAASLAMGSIGAAGLFTYAYNGFPIRFSGESQIGTSDLRSESLAAYRQDRCFLLTKAGATFRNFCDGSDPTNARRIFLWGDSHAAHLFPGLEVLRQLNHDFDLAQFTTGGCPPVFGFTNVNSPQCRLLNDFVATKIATLKPDTVILAADWKLYDARGGWGLVDPEAVRSTVAQIRSMGVGRIVAIGQVPVWQGAAPRIQMYALRTHWSLLMQHNDGLPVVRNMTYLQSTVYVVDAKIRQMFAGTGVIYISPLATFCNEQGCLLATPDGDIIDWDDSHFTKAGSIFFAKSNARALIGERGL